MRWTGGHRNGGRLLQWQIIRQSAEEYDWIDRLGRVRRNRGTFVTGYEEKLSYSAPPMLPNNGHSKGYTERRRAGDLLGFIDHRVNQHWHGRGLKKMRTRLRNRRAIFERNGQFRSHLSIEFKRQNVWVSKKIEHKYDLHL